MNFTLSEWLEALLYCTLLVGILLLLSSVLAGSALLLAAGIVIGVAIDVIMTPWRWFSSLFSFPKGRRTREEEDG